MHKESGGIVLKEPDARKAIYLLEGKERVEMILQQLEGNIKNFLLAGEIFNKTARLARRFLGMEERLFLEERKRFEFLLKQCESEGVYVYLTEDEKKKVKLWKMMTTYLEK
jgi:hypothetical protein